MALRYGYFDSEITGVDSEGMPIFDRAENSELFALLFKNLVTNGVLASPGDCFQVLAGDSGLTVKIRPGFGMINGRFAYDESETVLTLATSPTSYSRIDWIVLRCNYLNRLCEIVTKTGEAASSPKAPDLQQPESGDYYELGLAQVKINANQSAVSQSNITDTRADSRYCGYITQLIDHLDTSVFSAQLIKWNQEYQARADADLEKIKDDLSNYETESRTVFDAWFQQTKDQLSTDAAGNLQNQINNLSNWKLEGEVLIAPDSQ